MKKTMKKILISSSLSLAVISVITLPTQTKAIDPVAILATVAGPDSKWLAQAMDLTMKIFHYRAELKKYEMMVKSIGRLPQQQWDQFRSLFLELKNSVDFRTGITLHATDYKAKFRNLFVGYESYLAMARGNNANENIQKKYKELRKSVTDNVRGTLEQLDFSLKDMESDELTMKKLQAISQSAVGQKAAIQAANAIAMHQTHALKKLHNTMAVFASMQAQNLSTINEEKLIEQAGKKAFMLNRVQTNPNDDVPAP